MPGWQILKAEILVVQKNMWFDPGGEIVAKLRTLEVERLSRAPQQAATHNKARMYDFNTVNRVSIIN